MSASFLGIAALRRADSLATAAATPLSEEARIKDEPQVKCPQLRCAVFSSAAQHHANLKVVAPPPCPQASGAMTDETALPPPSLIDLDEDTLKLLLGHCDALSLCRVEQGCRHFFLRGEDNLSLPECAARATVLNATALGAARPYERRLNEPFKQVLLCYERGLLGTGVLHDIPLSSLDAAGWRLAYCQPYAHRTRDADIDAVPPDATHVLLAAYSKQGARSTDVYLHGQPVDGARGIDGSAALTQEHPVYALLAWGRRETVLRTTHERHGFRGGPTQTNNQEAGVYFYR